MEDDTTYFFDYNVDDHDDENAEVLRTRFIDCASAAADALNDLLASHLPYGVDFTISFVRCTFSLNGLAIQVSDNEQQGIGVVANSDVMPRRRLDPLREELRAIVGLALLQPSWNTFAFGCMLLQLAESAVIHLREFQERPSPSNCQLLSIGRSSGWDATSVYDWTEIIDIPHGVNLLTVNDTAKSLLGRSISEICGNINSELRVLHVEPVFRSDLVTRFLQRRRDMKKDLMEMSHQQLRQCVDKKQLRSREVENSVEGIAEYLSTPNVTFHGAPRSAISSIVRYGFLKPGEQIGRTNAVVEMECGGSYGTGVYSSPSLEYASVYGQYSRGRSGSWGCRHPSDVPGLRMIICATLMGRPLQVGRETSWRAKNVLDEHAQSHISPNGLEYIVFDNAQIIPCYVLHLDYGAERARKVFDDLQNDPSLFRSSQLKPRIDTSTNDEDALFPSAQQARKDALKAAAAKWFPYGFGPAQGTRFVIEEIGDVSDDEEEYGEFQAIRGEQEKEVQTFSYNRNSQEKRSWFDEYQSVRHTKGEVQLKKDEYR